MRATVTSKGQITIPKEIRERAHIITGTQLDFQITADGRLVIRPLNHNINKLKGIAKKKNRHPIPLEAMKQAVGEGYEESIE